MESECMPTVTLTIRPMVQAICQHMGIENSELAEAIRDSVEYETKKQMVDIPKMVKNEVNNMFNTMIHESVDSYAVEWMTEKWVRDNPNMLKDFRRVIKTQVMIAITKYVEENGKIIKKS